MIIELNFLFLLRTVPMTRHVIKATALHRPTFRSILKHSSPLGAGLFLHSVKLEDVSI